MKYVLVALVLAVAVWVLLARARRGKSKQQPTASPAPQRSSDAAPGEASASMVACSHCGVHLPQSEAVFNLQGQAFCSTEHQRAGPRKG